MSIVQTMKNTIRNFNAEGALANAREALAQAEQRIVDLEGERAQKLIDGEGDYLAVIEKIDREISSLRANAIVHRDRMDAMKSKRLQQAKARLEQEKAAGIVDIKKLVDRRRAAAGKLDEAVKHLAAAFGELIAEDEKLFKGWPDVLPSASGLNYTRATVLSTLSARRQASLIRELAALAPTNFTGAVDEKNIELLAELESAALPEMLAENAA